MPPQGRGQPASPQEQVPGLVPPQGRGQPASPREQAPGLVPPQGRGQPASPQEQVPGLVLPQEPEPVPPQGQELELVLERVLVAVAAQRHHQRTWNAQQMSTGPTAMC